MRVKTVKSKAVTASHSIAMDKDANAEIGCFELMTDIHVLFSASLATSTGATLTDTQHETYEGLVEEVLPGGEGIVRQNHQSIRISHVAAGEHIRFRIHQKRHGVWRGELLEVLKPAPQRINSPCAVASQCGACALQHISQHHQATLKTSWVKQAFSAFINTATHVVAIEPHQQVFAGRRRVRWFVDGQRLGFRKQYSHQVVHSTECIALTQCLDSLRHQLEQQCITLSQGIVSIQAVELSNGIHLILESHQEKPDNLIPHMLTHDNKPIQWWWRKLETPSIQPLNKPIQRLFDTINLTPYTHTSIDIHIGPNDFIQGHQQGNQTLISQILAWTKHDRRVVDLFSGCGNLSLPIAAAHGAQVIGAEMNHLSVSAANNNAKRLQLNATYLTLDLFKTFDIEPFVGVDTLIIDPPRKGAKYICKNIAQFFAKQVIMVHCDAAAGARDAQSLQQAGFKLKILRPLDLFPHTGHVEVISLWVL